MSETEHRRPRHALVDVPAQAVGRESAVEPESAVDVAESADVPESVEVPSPIDAPGPVEASEQGSTLEQTDAVEPVVSDGIEPPTAALPIVERTAPEQSGRPAAPPLRGGFEFTDDATMVLPVIPPQRPVPPGESVERRPYAVSSPAGLPPATPVSSTPRRRVLPAVLAGVTACLLVAGVVVGVSGAAGTDLTGQPPSISTP